MTLGEIAALVGGEVVGDERICVTGLSGISEAGEGDITFVANDKYVPLAKKTCAAAVITSRELVLPGKVCIRTDNPSLAFAQVSTQFIQSEDHYFKGVHPTAIICEDVILGDNVSVGPYTIIEPGCRIEPNTVIYGGCYIGRQTSIGKDGLIYANVSIREKTLIGDRVILHSSSVIGADGFGYVLVNGSYTKIPQVGRVVIESDVEIGACSTVDRARFGETVIGEGCKIDNLVQIAHNVSMGKHCTMSGQSGVSGSARLEDNVVLGGQVGISGHVTVHKGAVIAGKAGVSKDVPAEAIMFGYPAKPLNVIKRINAATNRLPLYAQRIKQLEQRLAELEERLDNEHKSKNS